MSRQFPGFSLALALCGLVVFEPGRVHAQAGSSSSTPPGAIRRITLPHFEPRLPVAPGRDEFMRGCLACHSARYVTMQPPFSRRQWEDSVRKMINVYGAPLDEFQAGKIIDYLFAIGGNGPAPRPPAVSVDDEESAAAFRGNLPQPTESVRVPQVVANSQERIARNVRGAELFKENCAGCHGGAGRGDGVVMEALLPKSANLTAARFSQEFLRQTLWNGVLGASMPSWRKLPPPDLAALAAYVQSLHSDLANAGAAAPESIAQGGTLYLKNCAACHGPSCDGKAPVAATLAPAPSNFKWMQPDTDLIVRSLRDGIPGTAMPAWKDQLTESDRAAVSAYVRSIYEPEK